MTLSAYTIRINCIEYFEICYIENKSIFLCLQTAKVDPYNAVTFRYLGDYYCKEGHDKVRGEKCYQKSYDLDPYNDETGEALCDLLNDLRKEVGSFIIYK